MQAAYVPDTDTSGGFDDVGAVCGKTDIAGDIEVGQHTAVGDVDNAVRPISQTVENMGSVNNAALAALGLQAEKVQQLGAGDHVEVDSNLVEQQQLEGLEQAHAKLDAALLAVAEAVHAPAEVDVEDTQQLCAALAEVLQADAVKQFLHADVAVHYGHVAPLGTKVCSDHDIRGIGRVSGSKRVAAVDADITAAAQMLATEQLEQRGFAGAVGAAEQHALAPRQHQVHVCERLLLGVWELVAEACNLHCLAGVHSTRAGGLWAFRLLSGSGVRDVPPHRFLRKAHSAAAQPYGNGCGP